VATRERQIVLAVLQALRSANIASVGANVFDERGFAIEVERLPAVDVLAGDSSQDVMGIGGAQLWTRFALDVAVVARETASTAASGVADPIVAAVHQVLMRSTAVRVLVRDLRPQSHRVLRQESGDGVVVRRTLSYLVEHVTFVDDLEVAPT
jgi:hypothetical protein